MKIIYFTFLVLLANCFTVCGQSKISGTWLRYDHAKHVMEVFVVRPSGEFVANLFDADHRLVATETGTSTIAADSVQFTFRQVIAFHNSRWEERPAAEMKEIRVRFQLSGKELKVGPECLFKRKLVLYLFSSYRRDGH